MPHLGDRSGRNGCLDASYSWPGPGPMTINIKVTRCGLLRSHLFLYKPKYPTVHHSAMPEQICRFFAEVNQT
jgi:hypothetical protein